MSDQFIGIDVGGTKIASATLQDGALSEPELEHTQLDRFQAVCRHRA